MVDPSAPPPAPDAHPTVAPPNPGPSPPAPAPPAPPPAPAPHPGPGGPVSGLKAWVKQRNDRTQARWDALVETHGHHLARKRLLLKVALVHIRYTCAYLATAFLVSTPYQLIWQLFRATSGDASREPRAGPIVHSLLVGLALLLIMAILIPLTRIDWSKMRLPEFKVFELNLAWWALVVSAAYLALSIVADPIWGDDSAVGQLCDRRVALPVFTLMAFSWVRGKFDAWLFKDFYTLHPDDDSLVLFKSVPPPASSRAVPRPVTPATEVKPVEATPAAPKS
jgi:hypothetical protein